MGIMRARDLSNQRPVSARTLRRMKTFFDRHNTDRLVHGWENMSNPSSGWINWLLWGGDPGRRWVERVLKRSRS